MVIPPAAAVAGMLSVDVGLFAIWMTTCWSALKTTVDGRDTGSNGGSFPFRVVTHSTLVWYKNPIHETTLEHSLQHCRENED